MTTMTDLLSGIVPDAVAAGDTLTGDYPIVQPVAPFKLKDYQQESLEFVFRSQDDPYAYLALDMGLGKSLVAWALIASVRAGGVENRHNRPALFVVPPSLRSNIVREQRKFYPHLKVHVITTADPQPGDTVPTDVDAIVLGDAGLKGSEERYVDSKGRKRSRFVAKGWSAMLKGKVDDLVVDEAHRHKNDSTRSKALNYVAEAVPGYRILMSGTPAPNGRNVELANQVDILGPSAWATIGGKGYFYTEFAPTVNQWGARESRNGALLFDMMSESWYLRILRDDVVDLPNKARSFIGVDGTGKGKRDYLKAETDLIEYLSDEDKNTRFSARAEALVKLNTLRRLAGVARVPNVVKYVAEIMESSDAGGVFVVAEHSEVIDAFVESVKLSKYGVVAIRGGMTDKQRDEAVDEFTSGEARIMVGQITSAGTGFTLHGDGLNHRVVFAQIPWTPADVRQAEDRLHRLGQTHDVTVELTGALIPEAQDGTTVDERLWANLESKAFAAGQLQDGEGAYLIEEVEDALLDSYRT